ncbi:TatD family hydrolase [Dactylosporangium sp. CS-047395]|uniref:TatD family hydrolase n=1 Tax=Dactylosporangium sp. CS-047395 TaxID=3239936 RepID=UPI003D8A8952
MTSDQPVLWDTHCHLDTYDNPVNVLQEATASGVAVVAVTEDPGRYRQLRTRLGRRSGLEVALGWHPLRIQDGFEATLARFLRLLPQATWVGEIGLDFSRAGADTKRAQLRVFDALLAQPHLRSHPTTVHSRGAENDCVTRLIDAQVPAILHWYTGSISIAEKALAGGLYFSINPAMMVSRRAAPLLAFVPPERVLLETDGPYTRSAGRAARPSDLLGLVRRLALIWNVSDSAARSTLSTNHERLLQRPADRTS